MELDMTNSDAAPADEGDDGGGGERSADGDR